MSLSAYEQPKGWDEKSEPLFRFQVSNKVLAWPFHSVLEAVYDAGTHSVILQFIPGTIIVTGSEIGQFYQGFCANKVTNLRVDGVEITSVDVALRGNE